jgi:SHS2 domain-containing protein
VIDGRVRAAGPASDRAGEWEHFAHGADIGVRGRGATPERAFEQAARALTAVVTDLPLVRTTTSTEVHCRAPDLDLLLYEWLNSLVFHMSTERLLFAAFDVRIAGDELFAQAHGEPVDVARHAPAVEVKGATLTELSVRREADGRWCAQCVIDV